MARRINRQEQLQERVAKLSYKAGISKNELIGRGRSYGVNSARIAIYAILNLDGYMVTEIADCFGRSHGTVISGINRILGLNEIGDKGTHEMFVKLLTD